MRQLAYAAMLAFCLVGTLPLNWFFHLDVLRQVRRLVLSITPVFLVFVAWDLAATHAGHWRFDPGQTLSTRFVGLPLEELGFFVVIPLAGLLTYEAVGVVIARRRGGS
ncbi:MAG TPA: lycopene cyclase domain-containing protein [Lapillicoccus sp.]|uniref:lycopene cyclase domain-containing protein n=1 Tax=Lapillicoccus sp. TaxID=1909287 RepID=UPI002F92E9AB